MTKELTDAERLERRTCRRCLTVEDRTIPYYRSGMCKECEKQSNDYTKSIPATMHYSCPVCETDLGNKCPRWCPTCKEFLDDPTECYY